jgi:peptidoglycan/xylan/chitin deacetylase (PgdA/CDA1 family)
MLFHPIQRRLLMLAAVCGAAGLAFGPCRPPARAQHISSGCTEGRRIALTFDDGPNPPFTGEILDVLRSRGVPATFFVEGEAAEAHPEIVRLEQDAGMAICAHSYAHGADIPKMSADAFRDDLDHVSSILTDITGRTPAIYRSPYGHTSDTMLEVEHEREYTSVGWDLDSTDWKDSSTDDIVSAVLDGAHPGAIVLMHDGGLGGGNPDRTRTLAALPRIIDGLRAQGYTFETVPELAGITGGTGDARGPACSAN